MLETPPVLRDRRQQKRKMRPSSRCRLIFDRKLRCWNGAGGVCRVCVFRIGSWFPLLGGTQFLVPILVPSPRVVLKHLVHGGQCKKAVFLSRKQPKLRRCHLYGGRIRSARDSGPVTIIHMTHGLVCRHADISLNRCFLLVPHARCSKRLK